jgi:hypothetical protein
MPWHPVHQHQHQRWSTSNRKGGVYLSKGPQVPVAFPHEQDDISTIAFTPLSLVSPFARLAFDCQRGLSLCPEGLTHPTPPPPDANIPYMTSLLTSTVHSLLPTNHSSTFPGHSTTSHTPVQLRRIYELKRARARAPGGVRAPL